MAWNSYGLDREAQKLVLMAKFLDVSESHETSPLNQAYKMRTAASFGLERFWGEHLRFQNREPAKSRYWKATWDTLARILEQAGVSLPNDSVKADDALAIQLMAEKLWQLDLMDQQIALAILTQLCDCLIWWTQRYKK
jgi:hypothetical protein